MKDDRYKVPVSVQLILKKDNNVLLLRRYNTGFADGHYALSAGHIEENEEIVEAMILYFPQPNGMEMLELWSQTNVMKFNGLTIMICLKRQFHLQENF